MSLSSLWESHLGRALLGTNRDGTLPVLPEPWMALDSNGEAPARVLAARLTGLSLAHRAGFFAPSGANRIPEAPADDRACAGPSATALLDRTLQEEGNLDLLPEWLDLCLASGLRPPQVRLPDLVAAALVRPDIARRVKRLMPAQLEWWSIVDPRSRRLSPPPADPDQAWDSPEPARRLEAFRLLRRRDPLDARERLRAAWKGESAEARAALVEALLEGLGPEDEPFLETCLDDRSKAVRAAAAGTLARLEGSDLVRRLHGRMSSCLVLRSSRGFLGMGRSTTLEVELPPAGDPALERDLGIGPNPGQKPSPVPAGERARLLGALVARGGLRWWATHGIDPREVLEAALRTEFAEVLVFALVEAAHREGDAAWAEILLATPAAAWREELLDVLPPPRRDEILLDRLRSGEARAFDLLLSRDPPWDAPRTRTLLDHAWAERAAWREPWRWRSLLPLATSGDVAILAKDLPRWRGEDVPEGLARLFAQRIEFRIDLHTAFAKEVSP